MAQDATGTPTAKGIPKYNTAVDAPSGKGFNAAIDVIDGLLSDRVQTGAATLIANKLLAADANPSFKIMGDGSIQWGAGGASALDVNLYRGAPNNLKTDSSFSVASRLVLSNTGTGGDIIFQGDTNLYRASANLLKTDDSFVVAGALAVTGASGKSTIDVTDTTGTVGITLGTDTNLYRSAANILMTDDTFQSSTAITLTPPNADLGNAAYDIWAQGKADRYFYINRTGTHAWGDGTASPDTNLYRGAANSLRTDDNLIVRAGAATLLEFGDDGGGKPGIFFGSGYDVNLYRSAANTLKTDDAFVVSSWAAVDGETYIDNSGAGNKMFFGSARDTNLYRSSANILRTDDAFVAPTFFTQEGAGTVADNTATTQTISFGSRGMFLLNAWLSGANEEVEVSWLVQAGPSNLNAKWFELVRGDYNIGDITIATQDGGAQWGFNASSVHQVKVTFTNQPTGGGTANWAWRATRLA